MDIEHKLFAIYLLKRVALADKTFQMTEQRYLDQAAHHLDIDRQTLNSITPEDYEVKSMPAREQDRMTILYYLLFLSQADGVILNEEKSEIRKIGFELGFRDTQIVKMIDIIESNDKRRFDPEELLKVIRIVLN